MILKNTPKRQGAFIVIEGTDGSGKSTQFKRLAQRLEREGYKVEALEFPQHTEASAYFVEKFLRGEYGALDQISPYAISLFYTLDRYDAKAKIEAALAEGKVVLAGRYTGSGMAHQGANFGHAEERRGFFIWLDSLEFETLKIPRPDKSFVLRVPFETSQALLDHTGKKLDIHEANHLHLQKTISVFDDLVQLFPKDFTAIDCVRGGQLMSADQVEDMLWKTVQPLLPNIPKKPAAATVDSPATITKPENPYIRKGEKGWEITEAGKKFLKEAVTDSEGNVYAFSDKLSTLTIAAAMARLSRRGDDMRITILDEFAVTAGKDDALLRRVITAFGDDSVQQLAGLHVVVENASNLLTKQLEWGRLASYLEQSTRYIYFDQKDQAGKFKYYAPDHLDDLTKAKYRAAMDSIFELYSIMVRRLTDHLQKSSATPKAEQDGAWRSAIKAQACDAVRPVLPVATKSTVGIFASGQALEALIMRLRASDSREAQVTGDAILAQARKVIPTFLERADKPDRGGATTAYMANTRRSVAELSQKYLPDTYSNSQEPVSLQSAWPRNELDLVPHMLYESSSLSLAEIERDVSGWPIDRKLEVFSTYMGERLNRRHRPGRALEQAHYTWDLVCDYGIFRDLQRHRMVDDLQWQALTPRYGYEMPKLIEEAGLAEAFEKCFDLSAKLYSALQAEGYGYEAQYATLLGHRMRWKVTMNAREAFHFHELRTSPQGHPGYRKLVQQMHEKLAEVHPLLTEAMRFVNQDEDPELTRLAAERATQFKLAQMEKIRHEPHA
ncbi:MAG TPA: FAD-dependent thymidylate synthase [Candidatus Limnocylindria bacterium]|nr:FAD-dependent thymidylate synthase [Candidatus Limnocylindria bacterium]